MFYRVLKPLALVVLNPIKHSRSFIKQYFVYTLDMFLELKLFEKREAAFLRHVDCETAFFLAVKRDPHPLYHPHIRDSVANVEGVVCSTTPVYCVLYHVDI